MSEQYPLPATAEPSGAGSDARVRQLLALNHAAVAITGELDLDALLQRIVDAARELVGCKYAALGVLGDDGFIARFPTSGVSDQEREEIGAPPRGHGLLGVMLRAGRTLRIPNIAADPRRSGFPPHHPPMTSLLGAPIFVQGSLAGDIYLTDKIGSVEFSEEDEWLVQLLAIHATTALSNARLHAENVNALQRVERERANSQALFRVTHAVNRSVELQQVISLIVSSAAELLGAAGAALHLLEPAPVDQAAPEGLRFSSRYASGLDQKFTTGSDKLPVGRSIAGRSVRTGHTQIVPDTAQEPDIVFPRLAVGTLRSLVAVPLSASGGMLGVLSIYYDRLGAAAPEDVGLLEAFAAVASAAVHNATLYEQALKGRAAAEREQARLRELEQMKDEFLSTAAHELRTPLTTIRISVGLAHEQMLLGSAGKIDPRLIDLVGLAVEGAQRMQALVNDLLDLTRLEQGRATMMMEPLDLRAVARAAIEATRALFEDKAQPLLALLPEEDCAIRGDQVRLEQLVINLLSNATKYSPKGAPVELRLLGHDGDWLLEVRDHGSGVPADELEHIFERFYRSSHHRSDRTASTGLGLPIARQIAEMHRGRVWAELAPGGGSIFTLSLPTIK